MRRCVQTFDWYCIFKILYKINIVGVQLLVEINELSAYILFTSCIGSHVLTAEVMLMTSTHVKQSNTTTESEGCIWCSTFHHMLQCFPSALQHLTFIGS
jgi:hypothetical protein